MKHLLLGIVLTLFIVTTNVFAQNVSIEVDPSDTPLVIVGWVEEENAFIGNLRLTASEDTAFTFLASDLLHETSSEKIGRQNINFIGDTSFEANKPKNFQISVSGIQKPGVYQGQIEILLPGQNRTQAFIIPLQVIAKVKPVLTLLPGTKNIQLRLVQRVGGLDYVLARQCLSDSAFLDTWFLHFENFRDQPVTVLSSEVVLLGETTGYKLTGVELSLPSGQQMLPPKQIGVLPLTINRSAIPPDHYTGSIYLVIEGLDAPITIPIDLSMRIGPSIPLTVLFIGLLLGRTIKYMQGRGTSEAEKLEAIYRLQAQVDRADSEDRSIIQPMVDEVQSSLHQETLETVTTAVNNITARLKSLRELRSLETSLKEKKEYPQVKEALVKIGTARTNIQLKRDEDARILLEEVKDTLATLPIMMGSTVPPDIVEARKRVESAVDAVAQATEQSYVLKKSSYPTLKRVLVHLSGLSDEIRAEATLWLVRPLLSTALLVGLLIVGIASIYVTKGAAFGANPITDYMELILWGLSSDVASRSLANLRAS